MAENVQNCKPRSLQIQEVQKISNRIKKKHTWTSHCKTAKNQWQKLNFIKPAREKLKYILESDGQCHIKNYEFRRT